MKKIIVAFLILFVSGGVYILYSTNFFNQREEFFGGTSVLEEGWKRYDKVQSRSKVGIDYPSYFSIKNVGGMAPPFSILSDDKGTTIDLTIEPSNDKQVKSAKEFSLNSVNDKLSPSSYGKPATLTVGGKTFYKTYLMNAEIYTLFADSKNISVVVFFGENGIRELYKADIEKMLGSVRY